jgi:LmbE family N-acetylglucosaminyl deacetylase
MQDQKERVLLSVLAHPDDESFGMGGSLALYAERGVKVHLVCATRGESGEVDPEYLEGFETVADRRMSELRCAAGVLGLTGVYFLDYRDSGMPGSPENEHPQALVAQPLDEVAAKIVTYMRKLKPDVVLTFDPIGGYRHPDHIAIHKATVRAFELSGDPSYEDGLPPYKPARLYYHHIPKGLLRWTVRLMPLIGKDPSKFGRNQDIDLAALVKEGDFPVHAKINYREVRDKRDAAADCHASQLGSSLRSGNPISRLLRLLGSKDQFTRAYPEPEPGLKEKDLFAGL